jgi:DNA-binding response OmpR family regulator
VNPPPEGDGVVWLVGFSRDRCDEIGAALLAEGLTTREVVERAPTRTDRGDVIVFDLDRAEVPDLERCRKEHSVPILALVSGRDPSGPIRAFEAGADDVVRRPHYPREVALRVRALLRAVRAR